MSDTASYFIVKGTLLLLVVFSALTWAVVLAKALQQWRVKRDNRGFSEAYRPSAGLPSRGEVAKYRGPTARVAAAGIDAWNDASETIGHDEDLDVRRDVLERSLRQQLQKERRGIESGLAVLASIGTTAPFVGLFGTVWGIIHALSRISGTGSASLEVVAGPIGEALIATGIGIAVAVPAVLAYNVFVRRLKLLLADLEDFANSFVNSAIKASYPAKARDAQKAVRSSLVRREASA